MTGLELLGAEFIGDDAAPSQAIQNAAMKNLAVPQKPQLTQGGPSSAKKIAGGVAGGVAVLGIGLGVVALSAAPLIGGALILRYLLKR